MSYCTICKGRIFKKSYDDKKYQVMQCKSCGFGFLKNAPSPKEIESIYRQDYFDDKKTSDYILDAEYKFKYVKRYLKNNSKVLDFGCGIGDFVGICKKNSIQIFGFDLSEYALRHVNKKYDIITFSSIRSLKVKNGYFDALVSFDVVEHISDYYETLELFHQCLKPGGLLFMTTPNIEGWDAKILKKFWYGYRRFPQHINFFSPRSMKILLEKQEFFLVEIRQWGFVRDFDFVFNRYFSEKKYIFNILHFLAKASRLDKKKIFFPMVDMMIVARKL